LGEGFLGLDAALWIEPCVSLVWCQGWLYHIFAPATKQWIKEVDAAQRTRKSTAFTRQLMAWHDGGARPSACPPFTTYSTESAILYASPALWYMPCVVRQAAWVVHILTTYVGGLCMKYADIEFYEYVSSREVKFLRTFMLAIR
jgi:hypothetical protein